MIVREGHISQIEGLDVRIDCHIPLAKCFFIPQIKNPPPSPGSESILMFDS
ncbi:hypothetical protein KP77_26720 [Jeotgalibacillus alimentarius]|uniref:Uncharacterized protein n=1 Tax=Jeotgalibacillus alimentarius TaxID=135826 RepID=A0A0C2R8K0_9BACL|nr:hypothetical protein KP77_26720 [Jeotgalibacillus alimentarius]